jgi:hypothetical protein
MAALLSVPFWHAPALVLWGGQGVWQALFSSTLSLWRAKGAYLVYGLAWTGASVLLSLAIGLIAGTLGARSAIVLMVPALAITCRPRSTCRCGSASSIASAVPMRRGGAGHGRRRAVSGSGTCSGRPLRPS